MSSWAIDGLTSMQRTVLTRGNLRDVSEIVLSSNQEIARKCKISAAEAQSIIDALYNLAPPPRFQRLGDVKHEGSETCTTGDSIIDDILGGGIRSGMILEIAGESAAGKTQFALQLSLFVQLPQEKKGLSGSTCYITTSSTLQTSRLVQMMKTHSSLLGAECDLKDIHTLATPTIPHLIHVLTEKLTPFIGYQRNKAGFKPVRLLVIDALAELFHTSDKTTTNTLVERSRNIAQISFLLHGLVRKHKLVVLVLNEVVDVFDRAGPDHEIETLLYGEQVRWFGRAHSVSGENAKEVSLGMVWANQINTRILLSRTGRRRFLDDAQTPSVKRSKTVDPSARSNASESGDLALIRRLSVIFSSVSHPASLDFVITEEGISALSESNLTIRKEDHQKRKAKSPLHTTLLASKPASTSADDQRYRISPLDVGILEDWKKAVEETCQTNEDEEPPEDEWDGYWATNTISQVELDTLDDMPS